MDAARLLEYADLAWGLPGYLRNPATLAQAEQGVRRRLASREENFLALMAGGVYERESSPYRRLLEAAGYSREKLSHRIRSRGLEATLIDLRDESVWLSAAEAKLTDRALDNPLRGAGVGGRSSGTNSSGGRVAYDWRFLAEEAESETLLYEAHGLSGAPTALWYPVHISIAGIHNLLLDLKRGQAPERWFSQSAERGWRDTAMRAWIAAVGRSRGLRVPAPRDAPVSEAAEVARWMQDACQRSDKAMLRTFSSSAVRAVQAGQAEGLDLRGCAVFAGGEPLGEAAAELMREAGVRPIPRYISTETGLVGAACPHSSRFDEMHVYQDRLAVIPAPDGKSLLTTTLLPSTGKILLNASLGDEGALERRPCACVFGRLGMDLFVRGVRSATRLTQQGMSVEIEELVGVVQRLVVEAGGAETDFQIWEHTGGRVTVAVSPELHRLDIDAFSPRILETLHRSSPAGAVAAGVWRGADALRVIRAEPRLTRGRKQKKHIAVE